MRVRSSSRPRLHGARTERAPDGRASPKQPACHPYARMCTRTRGGECAASGLFCVGMDTRCQPANVDQCNVLIRDGGKCRWSKTGRLDEKRPTDVCSPLCKMVLLTGVHWECANPSCVTCSTCVSPPPTSPSPPPEPPPPPPPPSPPPPSPPYPPGPSPAPDHPLPPGLPPSPRYPNFGAMLEQFAQAHQDNAPPDGYSWPRAPHRPPPPSPLPPPPPLPPRTVSVFSKVTHSRPALVVLCLLTVALALWLRRAYERTRLEDDARASGNCLVDDEEDGGASRSRAARKAGRASKKVKAKASGGRHKRYASVQTAEESSSSSSAEEPVQQVRRKPGGKTRGLSAKPDNVVPPEPLGREHGRERRAKATAGRPRGGSRSQGKSCWQDSAEARLTGEARQVGRALD